MVQVSVVLDAIKVNKDPLIYVVNMVSYVSVVTEVHVLSHVMHIIKLILLIVLVNGDLVLTIHIDVNLLKVGVLLTEKVYLGSAFMTV